jgi:hypothetical protein
VLASHAQALAARLSGEARARCHRLAASARDGTVPEDLLPTLQSLLDLALRERPLAQPVLSGIYARTARGEEMAKATRDVNAALRALRGQPLQSLHLTSGPGRYGLTIETDRVRLSLVLDDAGARVETAEMG